MQSLHLWKKFWEKTILLFWKEIPSIYWITYVYRQHFPDDNALLAAVISWVTSSEADFYEHSTQGLVHCWQKCIVSGGAYVEKIIFCCWKFALSNRTVLKNLEKRLEIREGIKTI